MSTPLIAIIFGAGPRVGRGLAQKLKSEGFKVAIGSRNPDIEKAKADGLHAFKVDLKDPENIAPAFTEVEKSLGGAAALVIYNAASFTKPPNGDNDPLSTPLPDIIASISVTGISAIAAAKRALEGFKTLPASIPKAFIATGNILPWHSIPLFLAPGAGKSAIAHAVDAAAKAYGPQGYKFYYAFEVDEKGGPQYNIDPASHAEVFYTLYKQQEQGKSDVRFVKGGKIVNA